jgi:hypothetical protein
MKKNSFLLAIMSLLVVAMSASADDLWPPSCRNGAGLISAEWDTWSNFSAPDTWSHGTGTVVGGTPSLTTSPSSIILATYQGRSNVLRFLADAGDDPSSNFTIDLPNFEDPPSGSFGVGAWVQITYWEYGAHPTSFPLKVFAGPDANDKGNMFADWGAPDGGWVNGATTNYVENGSWATVAMNVYGLPMETEWEAIKCIVARVAGGQSNYVYIDQVVVDSGFFPIPEPGTLVLLVTAGLGALCYAWRRRRS